MKNLLFIFSFFAFTANAQIYLSDPIPVSFEASFGTRTPRVQVLEDGSPVVYWGNRGNDATMYIAVWQDTAFSYPIEVPTGSVSPSIWGGALGPEIVTHDNTLFLTFESYGEGIYCIQTQDKGMTFSAPVKVTNLGSGRVATLPDIGVDDLGNPMISFVTTNQIEQEALYEIAFSKDGGQTFEPSIVANEPAAGEEVCECCPASVLAAKDSTLLLVFRNNDANIRDIWVSKSTDGGQTFSQAIDLDDTDWEIFGCPSNGPSSMVLGDTLYSTFYSLGEGESKVYLSTMHVADSTVAEQIDLPHFFGDNGSQNLPRLSGKNDTLGIVWQEQNGLGTDIILGYSTSGVSNLQYLQISNNHLSETNADVAFANGAFHIVYADQVERKVMYQIASFSPLTKTTQIIDNQLIRLSPNPFRYRTLVDVSGISRKRKMEFVLIDNQGQEVQIFSADSNQFYIEKGDLKSGIYFLRGKTDEGTFVKKLIVK